MSEVILYKWKAPILASVSEFDRKYWDGWIQDGQIQYGRIQDGQIQDGWIQMAKFKMDAIFKLSQNEWVWVRLN